MFQPIAKGRYPGACDRTSYFFGLFAGNVFALTNLRGWRASRPRQPCSFKGVSMISHISSGSHRPFTGRCPFVLRASSAFSTEGHAREANFDELWVPQPECLRSRPHVRTEGARSHAGAPPGRSLSCRHRTRASGPPSLPTTPACALLFLGPARVLSSRRRSQQHAASRSG